MVGLQGPEDQGGKGNEEQASAQILGSRGALCETLGGRINQGLLWLVALGYRIAPHSPPQI